MESLIDNPIRSYKGEKLEPYHKIYLTLCIFYIVALAGYFQSVNILILLSVPSEID